VTTNESELVDPKDACPGCGERDTDYLMWIDDQRVQCTKCKCVYTPGKPTENGRH
jgi:hypothetical protein